MSIVNSVRISRCFAEGFSETSLLRDGCEELFITATPLGGETVRELAGRLGRRVRQGGGRVTAMTVFNGRAGREAAAADLWDMFGRIEWPINWLESESSPADAPVGVELHALRGAEVRTLWLRDRVVGCVWEDAAARHVELGDLHDETARHPAALQAQCVLQQMGDALALAGMSFGNVYRTWFRNRDILAWYRGFNRVRTDYYTRWRVFNGLLPASTGISAGNSHGAALVAGLWAMEPKAPGIGARMVDSPLQGSACAYGSSFSRAVEVDMADHRRLTISGTASIDAAGKTVHLGNVGAQVDQTMRVVLAILNSRGMDWTDVTRGLVYFRRAEDMGFYERWRLANKVPLMPVIVTNHTVCRDDLLYECELDAVSSADLAM